LQKSEGLRPVVVWIYGGGFSLGGTRIPLYRGDRMVKTGDVIYVSLNYRVGVFGFSDFTAWSTPDNPIDSNLGLRDQVAALAWIKRNIAAFGGDPEQVTIVGQSAGGMSVASLMCIPSAAGLFQRAFAQSPNAGTAFGPERHRIWASELIKLFGLDPKDKVAVSSALKRLPAEALCETSCRFFYDTAPDAIPGMMPTSPVVDGDFLPLAPVEAFRQGKAHRVPLLIGTVSREGAILNKILTVSATRPNRLEGMFKQVGGAVRERIAAVYTGYPSKRAAIDVGGDFTFWQPSVLIAEAHSRVAPCWAYRFDYATGLTRLVFREATHGLDLPMLFGTTGEGDLGRLDMFSKQASREMSRRFQGVFLDFARGGRPNWSPYDTEKRLTRIFDRIDREESDPRRDRRLAWGDLVVS
jgi:para-nitrobenzyl esterase